ncbi:MAG: S-methyl-5'-thioadenosine phosphorylase [Myxococcota bacterium]|nr:S-methyl-5'-thioadenosine phosphorylase [Myxococcota bacterium]
MAEGMRSVVGVIGGSGVYELDGLVNARWEKVESPFGAPSDELLMGELEGVAVVFLPRHGRGHRIPPSEVNYRANVDALKRAGVTDLISVSACGSLSEELSPGTFVLVDQFVDRTFARSKSFFSTGCVAHVSMAQPVCERLGGFLECAARDEDVPFSRGGTYLAMEGPQFSSRAESELYRSWGCHVIGMTNMPEAKLAREAELCYATLAMVTDYDCWHDDHDDVQVADIVAVLTRNAENARALLTQAIPSLDRDSACRAGCGHSLDDAIITPPQARDPEVLRRLDAILARVNGAS